MVQQRLRGAGARPINNVVDATNYVMLELGQPLHAFDLNRLEGTSIVVRRPREKECRFTTLDEEHRALSSDMLMICDLENRLQSVGLWVGSNRRSQMIRWTFFLRQHFSIPSQFVLLAKH
ncbi:MAG: hypothetical protein CM1200mP14_17230 [Gammaproteobacteria bacterium]|nr:MAG: hypothetical protein CM1200mP14_17230 [Gammaproteobacteria bacterium]